MRPPGTPSNTLQPLGSVGGATDNLQPAYRPVMEYLSSIICIQRACVVFDGSNARTPHKAIPKALLECPGTSQSIFSIAHGSANVQRIRKVAGKVAGHSVNRDSTGTGTSKAILKYPCSCS
jgi:hypothetical protein